MAFSLGLGLAFSRYRSRASAGNGRPFSWCSLHTVHRCGAPLLRETLCCRMTSIWRLYGVNLVCALQYGVNLKLPLYFADTPGGAGGAS
jgi:hypothetical protein